MAHVQLVARSKEDILAARGVKPTLSPNLNTLATVEALDVKRLLFIGVGCQARCLLLTSFCLHCSCIRCKYAASVLKRHVKPGADHVQCTVAGVPLSYSSASRSRKGS